MAYPKGYSESPKLIVFYQHSHGNMRSTAEFNSQIRFDLHEDNQHDFKNEDQLSSVARALFDSLKNGHPTENAPNKLYLKSLKDKKIQKFHFLDIMKYLWEGTQR